MRIAVVHDWLDTWAGSEQALTHILALFPGATLFALVDFLSPEHRARIPVEHIHTTFIQHLPWARRAFRRYLPWFPLAIERLDLSRFDLVISSSHAVAKGARTRPDQLHICYCYTPMRYAWDLQEQYLEQVGLRLPRRSLPSSPRLTASGPRRTAPTPSGSRPGALARRSASMSRRAGASSRATRPTSGRRRCPRARTIVPPRARQ